MIKFTKLAERVEYASGGQDIHMYIYIYIYTYIFLFYSFTRGQALHALPRRRAPAAAPGDRGRAVQRYAEGARPPRRRNHISVILDSSARAGLDVFPYEVSLRSELRSPSISEKICVLQPPPSSAHRVPPVSMPNIPESALKKRSPF